MPRRKPQPADDPALKRAAGSASGTKLKPHDALTKAPAWKKAMVGAILLLVLLGALLASGVFDNIQMGPKVPIVRQAANFTLGMKIDEVAQKYKKVKKQMRPFNGDKDLSIVTLTAKDGYNATETADLIFFHDTLYYVSLMWNGLPAETVPLEDWAHQYRRWKQKRGGDPESMGTGVTLKEWHFDDGTTEMVLRDLKFNDNRQRWEELRDVTNHPAQAAFAKYKLEAGS